MQMQLAVGNHQKSASRNNASPDSVIYTLLSSASASASVDHCSFASDAHDRDSDISLRLYDCERHECSSGPDPDFEPNKHTVKVSRSRLSMEVEKAIASRSANKESNFEDLNQSLDSARSSFSSAVKECQERRSRSDVLLKKPDLDNAWSPRVVMKKSSAATSTTGMLTSPGTPTYRQPSAGMQKGWSSERVPLHTNAGQRYVGSGLLPYNNGRALPSKWEDAERWICSPVSADGTATASIPHPQRRPKSKSGPLGPPGSAYYSMYSPTVPMFEGMNKGYFTASSPFPAGVIAPDGWAIRSYGDFEAFAIQAETYIGRSASVHGCSEIQSQSSLPPQGQMVYGVKDAATNVSSAVSRKDMATQMSPEGSTHSSPWRRLSFSASSPSALPIVELQSIQSSKAEIRDVLIDEWRTSARWPIKKKIRNPKKGSGIVDDWKQNGHSSTSDWVVSEAATSISKVKRGEARITAWENLQKAKAEAAIRKLEMKLEKKRSTSMDKIMNKLRLSQKKAQEMRSTMLASQTCEVAKTSHNALSIRRTRQMSSLSGCFTCHAF